MSEIDKESQYGELKSRLTLDDSYYMKIPEYPDYLSFVDEDIRQMFDGKSCLQSDILIAQLIKEIRLLNANLRLNKDGRSNKADSVDGEQEWT